MTVHGRPPELPTYVIGNAWYIFADGDIDKGAAERLETFLREHDVPQKSEIVLNSEGGDLLTGMNLGRIIREHGLFTEVGKEGGRPFDILPGECYSACALAFLGGTYRFYKNDSEYGVHRFYSLKDEKNGLDLGQIISAAVVQYIRDMGVDPELFSLMTGAGATEIIRLTKSEMERLRVTNGGVERPKWSIESRSYGAVSAVYLKGERETWRGINKFLLVCLPGEGGRMMLHVIYDPEGRGDVIINNLHAHSLVIDDDEYIPISRYQEGHTKLVNGWINAEYILSEDLLQKIGKARSVGVAMQATYGAPIFMGFTGMEFDEGRIKLPGLLDLCRGNQSTQRIKRG